MTLMWIRRDEAGQIIGVSRFQGSGFLEQKDDQDPEVQSFLHPPEQLDRDLILTRMEAEPVGAGDAWDAYQTWVFATAARRNAFLKFLWQAKPIRQDNAKFRTTMASAGISAAAIERILAPTNGG